ncbi:hypothetical protein BOTCAL_0022g00500 [Botryotinia calthae]|uniref:F-box domain-containing protein n=1 Tax=Botryotinia calthae TaxID=38488 RepID=A0A4Y8DF12_9HELO|nr:hypothetical protein BOTCAL_0022g00500 [Botryotinia calthae]
MRNVPNICWSRVPPRTQCRFGDLPLEIIYNVMELLGPEGSICLGLTCPELHATYRGLYSSKISLRSLVDTTLPFRLYPVTELEMSQLYPPVELYKLVEGWKGLKDRYFFWENDLCWKSENAMFPMSNIPVLDGPSTGVPDRFLLASFYANNVQDMKILQERYQDYEYTRNDCTSEDLDEDVPVHSGPKGATLLLQASRIPSPFNIGVEWDRKAKQIIMESINLAPCALYWQLYWKFTHIWQRNALYFGKKWNSAEAAEEALNHYPEWIEMIGF